MRQVLEVLVWCAAALLIMGALALCASEVIVPNGGAGLVCPQSVAKTLVQGAHVPADAGGEPGAAAAEFSPADKTACEDRARAQALKAGLLGAGAIPLAVLGFVLTIRRRGDPEEQRRLGVRRNDGVPVI